MKVSIELALKTREVYQLFERRIDGDRLFIDAILHKFNIILDRCRQKTPDAPVLFNDREQNITRSTQYFIDEIKRLEGLLTKKKAEINTKINYVVHYQSIIIVTNRLGFVLIEFIENYDKLIALLKTPSSCRVL